MTRFSLHRLLAVSMLAVAFTGAVNAAPTEDPATDSAQIDDYAAGKLAIDAKDWKTASDLFAKVVSRYPRNADAYNLLGYSLRWQGRYDEAFAAYGKALKLNPEHKGALNYSGIAYIKTGRLPEAQGQLERLKAVCANCEETAELSKAIADARGAK
jgi:Flp pilus assembly protein TadD